MGVFLRWGVFGILSVAALLYAYNASKRMAENHQASVPPAASQPEAASDADAGSGAVPAAAAPAPTETISAECAVELRVAELALTARRESQPVDRLLRSQEIAFVSDEKRRRRLEDVARKWFGRLGPDPAPQDLRDVVLEDCWRFSPAP